MKKNNKGFTLAELLIVVAIIAVLVGISIPVFTGQLEKAREATDLANIRAAYAEASVNALETETDGVAEVTNISQTTSGWEKVTGEVAGIAVPAISKAGTAKVVVTVPANGTAPTITATAK